MSQRALRPISWGVGREDAEVDFVLIRRPSESKSNDWGVCSSEWRDFFDGTGTKVRLLAFDHPLQLNENTNFHSFIEEGQELCALLEERLKQKEQAFCEIAQKAAISSQLCDSLLCMILLGGMSLTSMSPEEAFERLLPLLKVSNANLTKKALANLQSQVNHAVFISETFEACRASSKVLSLFESAPSKVRLYSKFRLAVRQQIVEQSSAIPGTGGSWALHGSHADLTRLEQSPGQPDLRLRQELLTILDRSSVERAQAYFDEDKAAKDSPFVPSTAFTVAGAEEMDKEHEADDSLLKSLPTSMKPSDRSSTSHGQILAPIVDAFKADRPKAELPCYMLGTFPRNQSFVGRQDILHSLDAALLPSTEGAEISAGISGQTCKHVVLCGMGGLGKTSAAVEFVHTRKDRFDAVFWVRADDAHKLQQDFATIASLLKLQDPESLSMDPVIGRELAIGWLTHPVKQHDPDFDVKSPSQATWLIVFDNADSPDLLKDYWPVGACGSILVTSRDPLAKSSPSKPSVAIDMPALSVEESTGLLCNLSGRPVDDKGCAEVAQQLDGLPLAISQMSAIIKYQYLTFDQFLDMYQRDASRKELHQFSEMTTLGVESRGTIASICAVENLGSEGTAIMQIVSLLDPDRIQESVLRKYTAALQHVGSYPINDFAYFRARAEILRRSLIGLNESTRELYIHRIVQDSVRSLLKPDQYIAVFRAAVALVRLTWGYTPLHRRHDWTLSKARASLFPHAVSLKTTYDAQALHKRLSQAGKQEFGALMNEAAWWQHERGASQEAKSMWLTALKTCHHFDEAEDLLADVHYGLSAAANETNDAVACLHHTKLLLQLRIKAASESGVEDLRLAIAYNENAIAHTMNEMYDAAIAAYQKSITIYSKLDDFRLAMDTNPRTNLAFTYWVMGEHQHALDSFNSLLEDRQSRFGINDTESYRTGRVLHGLGNVHFSLGKLAESKDFHERALAHYQLTIGNDHHKTADLCYHVAQHCLIDGDIENAIKLSDQALRIWRAREHVFGPEIGRMCFLRGKICYKAGREEAAEMEFARAFKERLSVKAKDEKKNSELTEQDFDSMITFFSR